MMLTDRGRNFCVIGGAGFIGSHFVDRLLADIDVASVVVYDNFSSGRRFHLAHHGNESRLRVISGDVKELNALTAALTGVEVVIHLASNPDIAKAMTDPQVDFIEGTALTNNVVEAMRRSGAGRILYASGSGVYGDLGYVEAEEDHGPLIPSSTYGASKLAGEALIAAYAAMFGISGCVFRFGNVVGARQTHGVGFDFVRRLSTDKTRLRILGDGRQSKSYIHVDDVVDAVLLAHQRVDAPFQTFNVATGDYISVREIADLAVECMGLSPMNVAYEYTGGDRGWKGDVPIVRLETKRIRGLGWKNRLNTREAVQQSLHDIREDVRIGRIQ
ncbi:MAG TPA: NAD-dependent epimerase/dehydratase family protein [Dongiaceae bacterium]|nr:NAD-dependent epimerase/dehydratase family protein [Dongiaceae bacterium]